MRTRLLVTAAAIICTSPTLLAQASSQDSILSLDRLELRNVLAQTSTYRGISSLAINDSGKPDVDDASRFAVVGGPSFQDGTIAVMLAGDTAPDARPELRGFVGIAFRVSADGSHFECFYMRPKNGRSEDQLQRNHSVQYISMPGFPWQKLRTETPGKYEAYVDLIPGAWTRVKIEVKGPSARLYVNGGEQPTLVVNDLKQAPATGRVALWVGPGTIAHFAHLENEFPPQQDRTYGAAASGRRTATTRGCARGSPGH
jgi:hypothetical protein